MNPNRPTTDDERRNGIAPKFSGGDEERASARARGRAAFDAAAPKERRRLRRKFREASERVDAELEAAQTAFDEGRFDETLDRTAETLGRVEGLFDPDAQTRYYRWRNPIEEAETRRYFPTDKAIRRAPIDYPRLYRLRGAAALERRRFADARDAFKAALAFNPVDCATLWKFAELCERRRDFRNYLQTTSDGLRFAYRPVDLARGYRNLGAFYFQTGRIDSAAAIYFLSVAFDDVPEARRALQAIEARTGRALKAPSFDKIRRVFDEEEIRLGAAPETLEVVRELAETARASGNRRLAFDCFDVLCRLTDDPDARAALDELRAER